MAVSRLTKMTLLADVNQHDAILKSLQSIQGVEIEDIFQSEENESWLADYFAELEESDVSTTSEYNQWLKQIEQGMTFIRNHGSARKKIKELPRKSYTLEALEVEFNEETLIHLLKQIQRLESQWKQNEKERLKWQKAEEWATHWAPFDIDPNDSFDSVTIQLVKVAAESWETIREYLVAEKDIYFEVNYTTTNEVKFSIVVLKEKQAEVETNLIALGTTFEQNPYEQNTQELLTEAKEVLKQCVETHKRLTIEIGYLKNQIAFLQFSEEVLLARLEREHIKERLVLAKHLVVIRAWINQSDKEQLVEKFQRKHQNALFFSFEEPTKTQIEANQVPTKLANHRLVAPFEILTGMYAVPKYEEIDPTPWMAPFYLVFFGMMVADLGYGLLALIATTIALKAMDLPKTTQKFVKLFQILSVSIMAWGAIYGSFFGLAMPFSLLSPTEDFMTIFMLSVAFGVIQIYTGLSLAAKEHIKKKEYLQAISQGFSWQGILTGIFITAAGKFFFDSTLLFKVGMFLALFSALFVLLIPIIQSKSKIGGFFSGLYELYGISGYIGDFVSYSRLMALGISGGSIAMAFNMLVATMPPVARYSIGIVLIIALHGLNIFLSMLGAYVHAARLQYVEFFGKFYEGGGRRFDSFKPAEKYVNIEEKLEENIHD